MQNNEDYLTRETALSAFPPIRREVLDSFLSFDPSTDRFIDFKLSAPFSVCFQITRKCNLACPYCISSSAPNADYGLPTEKAGEVIRKVAEAGVKRLGISGGEPFIRDDMMDLLALATDLGLETFVTTNGFFITPEVAKRLNELNILIQVSVDGPKDVIDAVRGKGAFDAAINALTILNQHGVATRVNAVLQKSYYGNLDNHMEEVVNIAREVKAENLYFLLVCAQGRASKDRNEFCFSEVEESVVRRKIQYFREKYAKSLKVKMMDFRQYEGSSVLIDAYGNLVAQGWSDERCTNTGNIFEKSISELWMESDAFDHVVHLLQYVRHPILYR
jgi:MoaA/NifB/PqqE/SkfB family radical SAM enzyme